MREAIDVWETMRTARAIRRYRPEPVDDAIVLRCLEAATWAPSGGNQQPWRFVLLRSAALRVLMSEAAQRTWDGMVGAYGVAVPDADDTSSRARVFRAMHEHMAGAADVPVLVLFCVEPQAGATALEQGASIYPAMQNFLLAARAEGLGAAITLWHRTVEAQLRALIGMPENWMIAATVTAGWPAGHHGPLNRRPVEDVVRVDHWE